MEESLGLSGVGNQNCWDVSGFSVVFRSSLTYSRACFESSSVRTFIAAVDKGLTFLALFGVVMWKSVGCDGVLLDGEWGGRCIRDADGYFHFVDCG